MKLKLLAITLACTLPVVAGAQVYTWKDSSGRTHFSDQPPPNTDAKAVRSNMVPEPAAAPKSAGSPPVANASGVPEAKASAPKGWEERDRDFKQRQAEKAEADAKLKKEQEAKADKERYCSDLRRNIAMLERGGRVGKANEKGENIPMDDSQMQAEISRSKAQLAKDCK
ncbi:DUF4124 domain-containing protein [Uliginosibacterium aquaticum]|uniref:DUF4124 domain-containing protein n=1 Tax=Uliginosibacterium aquaticum TaxID=2731212 RepID=A0ABX2IFR5_9RHOO|nr:DUF4124 domain-containing protein [Uliginosibacterium aquaticum]NSL55057.1 DUF4124 domain-containing protein [Uliginosibacterium aquaticum]